MSSVRKSLKNRDVSEQAEVGLFNQAGYQSIVPAGGKLPFSFRVNTAKLLDVVIALSPQLQRLSAKEKAKTRKSLSGKLYPKTSPGYYRELSPSMHLAYFGQPDGHGTQHIWTLYCDDSIKDQLEILVYGSALAAPIDSSHSSNREHFTKEWGGLYLRSKAEVKIAEALDKTGVLFFANSRGRVGLQQTIVSKGQLTGRVEADFLVFQNGKCVVLEVDGVHHVEGEQVVRDYARDRVLLRSGVGTVRFTAKDCTERPNEVVAELLSILTGQ